MATTMLPEETVEDQYVHTVRATTTLEECLKLNPIGRVNHPSDVLDIWIEHQKFLMRQCIAAIKKPDDILATHNHFAGLGIYVRAMQKELGDKAAEVLAAWGPGAVTTRSGGVEYRGGTVFYK